MPCDGEADHLSLVSVHLHEAQDLGHDLLGGAGLVVPGGRALGGVDAVEAALHHGEIFVVVAALLTAV